MDILENIPVLAELNPVAPVTLKDIQKIHSSLTLENPLTFMIFLSKRPDLEQKDKDIYLQIIKRLKDNERFQYEKAMGSMVAASLPSSIEELPSLTISKPEETDKPSTDVYDA